MAGVPVERTPFARTQRKDGWFVEWFLYFAGLGFFLVLYPTWALLQNAYYRFDSYLSPFYEPELYGSSHAWIAAGSPGWWPHWLIWSPALLIMWAPAGFPPDLLLLPRRVLQGVLSGSDELLGRRASPRILG